MDFIERLFNISPDGGSGATELLFFLVLSLIVIAGVAAWRIRRRHHLSQSPRHEATS